MIELSRDLWYVRLYYVCARLQSLAVQRSGALPDPKSLCMLFRMYLWGVLSFLFIACAALCAVAVALVTLVAAVGFLRLGYLALFESATEVGRVGRVLFTMIFVILLIGFFGSFAQEALKKRGWVKEKHQAPRRTPASNEGFDSFANTVGRFLKDLDERSCTPIRVI